MTEHEKLAHPVELAAIINSFNRRTLLEKAISALASSLRSLPFGSAAVVFDAGSTDGSREFLNEWSAQYPDDRIETIRPAPDEATSFSTGVNAACARAIEKYPSVRWLLLYETDNWIAGPEPLLQARTLLGAQPQLAAAGFTVRLHSGTRCGYGIRFPSALSLAVGQQLTARWKLELPNYSPRRHTAGVEWFTCDAVFTSPLMIRREAWEASRGIDERAFPFADSDVDWACRCARLGWQMAVIESDAVVHDNLAIASAWSANRVIDYHRSRLLLLKRHRGAWVNLIKPLLLLRHVIESLLLMRSAAVNAVAERKLEKRRELARSVWRDYKSHS